MTLWNVICIYSSHIHGDFLIIFCHADECLKGIVRKRKGIGSISAQSMPSKINVMCGFPSWKKSTRLLSKKTNQFNGSISRCILRRIRKQFFSIPKIKTGYFWIELWFYFIIYKRLKRSKSFILNYQKLEFRFKIFSSLLEISTQHRNASQFRLFVRIMHVEDFYSSFERQN